MSYKKIKEMWENSNKNFLHNNQNFDSMIKTAIDGKKQTALAQLIKRYQMFSRLSIVCIFTGAGMFKYLDLPMNLRILTLLAFAIYLSTAGIMDYWLYSKLSEIDIANMKVSTVSSIIGKCRKRHHQFMMILIPMCMIIVGIIIFGSVNNKWALGGVICGVIGGIAIGACQYMRFMKNYQTLSEEDNDYNFM